MSQHDEIGDSKLSDFGKTGTTKLETETFISMPIKLKTVTLLASAGSFDFLISKKPWTK